MEYLGRFNTPGVHFYFYTVNKIEKIDDFKGQKLRVAPLYRAFALKLGTSPVTMPHSEIYAALERGVVNGLGFGGIDFTRAGFRSSCAVHRRAAVLFERSMHPRQQRCMEKAAGGSAKDHE